MPQLVSSAPDLQAAGSAAYLSGEQPHKRNSLSIPAHCADLQGSGGYKFTLCVLRAVHCRRYTRPASSWLSNLPATSLSIPNHCADLQGSGGARGQQVWPGGQHKFTRCVLYKENTDSQAALGLLGRNLHCKPGTLAVAGTKDKRACTSQHLTAWQVGASKSAESLMCKLHCKPGTLDVAATEDKRACTSQHLTAWQVGASMSTELLMCKLHCKLGTLAVAGTKDKRACTSQHLTAWQV